jgi:hypothetical protein
VADVMVVLCLPDELEFRIEIVGMGVELAGARWCGRWRSGGQVSVGG